MNRMLNSLIFKAKAVLCICVLCGAQMAITGCGTGSFAPGATTTSPLSPEDALTQKLAGTPFAGAKQIDVDSATHSFRLIDANGATSISGTYAADAAGEAYVSSLTLATGGKITTITINAGKEITDITTATGIWKRPITTNAASAPTAPAAPGARAVSEVDQFLSANGDLFAQAQQADEQNLAPAAVAATTTTVKTDDQAFVPLLWALAGAALWPLGVAGTLLWVVEFVVAIRVIFRV